MHIVRPVREKTLTDFHYKNINEFIFAMKHFFRFHRLKQKLIAQWRRRNLHRRVNDVRAVSIVLLPMIDDRSQLIAFRAPFPPTDDRYCLMLKINFPFSRDSSQGFIFSSQKFFSERANSDYRSCSRASEERVSIGSVKQVSNPNTLGWRERFDCVISIGAQSND